MTALVGPSGSGKSTIANLLARLWDVKSGSIIIRGMDIRNVPLAELMEQISMVFQRVYLFQDTIYNNISMLNELVEKIEVFNAEKVNGVWEQRLRIHYNCVGTIEIPSALPLPTPDVSVNTRKGVVVNYAPCDVAI